MAEERNERRAGPDARRDEAREVKVRLSDDVARGVYANGVMVTHTREEFVLDFALVVGSSGTIVSRVVVAPVHAKRLAVALNEHLGRFEHAHGSLESAGGPAIRIGFQPSGGEGPK